MRVELDLNLWAFPGRQRRFQRYLTDPAFGELPAGFANAYNTTLTRSLGFVGELPRSLILLAYFNQPYNHAIGRIDLVRPMFREQNQTAHHQFVFAVNDMFPDKGLLGVNQAKNQWSVLTPYAHVLHGRGALRVFNMYMYKGEFQFPNQLPNAFYPHMFYTYSAMLARGWVRGTPLTASVPVSTRLSLSADRWKTMGNVWPGDWANYATFDNRQSFLPVQASSALETAYSVLRYIRSDDPSKLPEVLDGRWANLLADSRKQTLPSAEALNQHAGRLLDTFSTYQDFNLASLADTLRSSWKTRNTLRV